MNDANDAEAICEAVTRASMRFVPIKSEAQHEVQALHRVREQLLKSRTALVNQVRACSRSTASSRHKELHARAGCCWSFSPIPSGMA